MTNSAAGTATIMFNVILTFLCYDIVCETFEKAIRYFLFKSQSDEGLTGNQFNIALERIRITDEVLGADALENSSPAQNPKVVTFGSLEDYYSDSPGSSLPNTPYPVTSPTFDFTETDENDDIEVTRL